MIRAWWCFVPGWCTAYSGTSRRTHLFLATCFVLSRCGGILSAAVFHRWEYLGCYRATPSSTMSRCDLRYLHEIAIAAFHTLSHFLDLPILRVLVSMPNCIFYVRNRLLSDTTRDTGNCILNPPQSWDSWSCTATDEGAVLGEAIQRIRSTARAGKIFRPSDCVHENCPTCAQWHTRSLC